MKSLKWMSLSLITAFSVSSCFIDIDDDPFDGGCLRGEGPIVSEELTLNRVDAIDLKIPGTVYLRQGPEQHIVVEGQSNIIDNLERDVRSGLWEIEVDRCVRNVDDLRIYITTPDIVAVTISGSGRVFSENQLTVDDVELNISGSGDISLSLLADDITSTISGSGNLRLNGEADEIRFRLTGSGDLKAFGLKARKGVLQITGSGDAEVFVTDLLDVTISGSGDVFYRGRPSLNVSVSGSGDVVDAN